jgi:thiosulfate/3-mercaptopyruvate sulfurtransferase
MLIETHQLKQLMSEEHGNLNILHAMVNGSHDPPNNLSKYYKLMEQGHIPTARVFPLVPYFDLSSGWFMTMPTQARFRKIARQLDLRINDTFVCYDTNVVHGAARLAWMLKGFGAKRVHVLNGTFEKWQRCQY